MMMMMMMMMMIKGRRAHKHDPEGRGRRRGEGDTHTNNACSVVTEPGGEAHQGSREACIRGSHHAVENMWDATHKRVVIRQRGRRAKRERKESHVAREGGREREREGKKGERREIDR